MTTREELTAARSPLMASDYVDQFIQAIEAEIEAVTAKGAAPIRLLQGVWIRCLAGQHVYAFDLPKIIDLEDDTRGLLTLNGPGGRRHFDCLVVALQDRKLLLSVASDLGEIVKEANLVLKPANTWERLLAKFVESRTENLSEKFLSSTVAFSGKSENLEKLTPQYHYTVDNPPNQSQKEAVELSFRKSLAIVWGAPGTGKTATIACAVESHLKAGRRVLFLSNTNSTVDSAVEVICAQTENSFYRDGKVLRLGISNSDKLLNRYPKVGMNHYYEERASIENKRRILLEQHTNGEEPAQTDQLLGAWSAIQKEEERLEKNRTLLSAKYRELEDTRAKLERTRFRVDELLREQEHLTKKDESLETIIDAFRRESSELNVQHSRLHKDYLDTHKNYTQEAASVQAKKLDLEMLIASKDTNLESLAKKLQAERQEFEGTVVAEASLLATTFAWALSHEDLPSFDVLVVDEANRVALPQLFWAISKSKVACTLFGDFNQFAPSAATDEEGARKWLAHNIFHHLNISSAHAADGDPRVVMLDTQYRMAQKIAAVADELFYGGYLQNARNTARLSLDDGLSGASPLVLADVSKLKPWAGSTTDGNAFNLINALVTASIAKSIITHSTRADIGIVTPYRWQCELISRILDEWELPVKVGTIHGFQDVQKDIIIFDTVDAPGSRAIFLDSKRDQSNSPVSLNVAMTSARKKLYLVAHKEYLEAISKERLIRRVLSIFDHEGYRLNTQQFLPQFLVNEENRSDPAQSLENPFWQAFCQDLRQAGQNIVIMSPFLSIGGVEKLKAVLSDSIGKGVAVTIFTRPATTYNSDLVGPADSGIKMLEALGCTVHLRRGMHQKIAVIDKEIAWEGNLNILNHACSQEHMRRLVGKTIVLEIVDSFGLSGAAARLNGAKHYCADCGSELIRRHGEFGDIMACPAFPVCKYEEQTTSVST
jgi:AAA domain